MASQWIGIDWDHTAWRNELDQPMEGFRDAISLIHERGHKVIVHSCNNPSWIREMCEKWDLRVDAIWGESPSDSGHKPVCSVYVDDRALTFTSWAEALPRALEMVGERPVKR